MRLNFMNPAARYAIAAWLVLFGCNAICIQAQTEKEKAGTGIVKGRVKLQDSKTHDGVVIRVVKAASATAKAAPTGNTARSARAKSTAETDAREVQTDAKGDFEITGLATGEYEFTFTKPGYKGFTSRKLEVVSGETLQLRKVIEIVKDREPYALIRGAVLYGMGFSLPNALVIIERIDGKRFKQETVSGEGGEFKFTLKPDKATYRLTASAPGYEKATQEITIEGDELRHVALTLQAVK